MATHFGILGWRIPWILEGSSPSMQRSEMVVLNLNSRWQYQST